MKGAPLRCFVALPLGAGVVRQLVTFQKVLADASPPDAVRWTSPDQLHLTLRFLGNVDPLRISELEHALREACAGTKPLRLVPEDLGGFPSIQNPRVIWVGLGGDRDELLKLQERIGQGTAPWAEREEQRGFHPHLTLGRVREKAMRQTREIGEKLAAARVPKFGLCVASEIELMRSQLSPEGSTYTTLATVSLK